MLRLAVFLDQQSRNARAVVGEEQKQELLWQLWQLWQLWLCGLVRCDIGKSRGVTSRTLLVG